MRQIKFRGIRKGDNTWLYGDLVHINGECHIFPEDAPNSPDYYEVEPESVGQFTGLKDKNGLEIYEGDIVLENKGASKATIEFYEGAFISRNEHRRLIPALFMGDAIAGMNVNFLEVIGCIHQNPELLKQ